MIMSSGSIEKHQTIGGGPDSRYLVHFEGQSTCGGTRGRFALGARGRYAPPDDRTYHFLRSINQSRRRWMFDLGHAPRNFAPFGSIRLTNGPVTHNRSPRPSSFPDMAQPRHLPPPPQTQARSSSTFVPPPLDGGLTIPQLYDWHFHRTTNHRLFVYPRADGSVRTIYWPDGVQAVYVGAKILRQRFKWVPGVVETSVVAILASSGACCIPSSFQSHT